MAKYNDEGTLLTDKRQIDDAQTWTDDDWDEYQSKSNIEIVDGRVQLAEGGMPESGLEHSWPFDEGSGSTVADSTGGADGTINGATWKTGDGKDDAYLDFDGTDDYVTVSADDVTSITSEISLSCWINPNVLGDNDLRFIQRTDAYSLWYDDDGYIRWELYDGSSYYLDARIPESDLSTDSWQMITGTYDGSEGTVYLDGEPKDTVSDSNSINDASNDLYFGDITSSSSNQHHDGGMDHPLIYSTALSDLDVTNLYDATKDNYS